MTSFWHLLDIHIVSFDFLSLTRFPHFFEHSVASIWHRKDILKQTFRIATIVSQQSVYSVYITCLDGVFISLLNCIMVNLKMFEEGIMGTDVVSLNLKFNFKLPFEKYFSVYIHSLCIKYTHFHLVQKRSVFIRNLSEFTVVWVFTIYNFSCNLRVSVCKSSLVFAL